MSHSKKHVSLKTSASDSWHFIKSGSSVRINRYGGMIIEEEVRIPKSVLKKLFKEMFNDA